MKSPCYSCKDERHPGCHARCEKYLEFRARLDGINAERQKYVMDVADQSLRLGRFVAKKLKREK